MEAKRKGNYNEGEESKECYEDLGNTFEHEKVNTNGGKVSQDEHDIDPQ